MNLKLNAGDLVMSSLRGLGMITKLNPLGADIAWLDKYRILDYGPDHNHDYGPQAIEGFRRQYLEYRKQNKL